MKDESDEYCDLFYVINARHFCFDYFGVACVRAYANCLVLKHIQFSSLLDRQHRTIFGVRGTNNVCLSMATLGSFIKDVRK